MWNPNTTIYHHFFLNRADPPRYYLNNVVVKKLSGLRHRGTQSAQILPPQDGVRVATYTVFGQVVSGLQHLGCLLYLKKSDDILWC